MTPPPRAAALRRWWSGEFLAYAAVAGLVLLRAAAFHGEAFDAALMLASVVFFAGVQGVLLLFGLPSHLRIVYGYLATPYYGNRALAEIWLGSPLEAAAGSFAPLLLGDLLLVLVLVRARVRLPLPLLVVLALLTLPLLAFVWVDGFRPGPFVYQYLNVARVVVVTWFVARGMRADPRDARGHRLVVHLGLIFAAMALFSGTLAFATGARLGFPGWGANVFANALCVVGTLCAWYALRLRSLWLGLFAAACLYGILGSGTRVALVVFVLSLVAVALLHVVPRRWRAPAATLALFAAVVVVLALPGQLLGAIADANPRLRAIGGVELGADLGAADVLRAVGQESSVRTRLTLWRGSLAMFAHSPLVGIGWGQWNWQKRAFGVEFDVLLDPHNGYLWLLAEGGLIVWLVLLGALLPWLARLRWSPFVLVFGLILVLELTNANVQKGLFGVLAAAVLGAAAAQPPRRAGASAAAPSGPSARLGP